RIDCCKRSSNGLGCVIQPCYEIGARWQPMGRRRAASLAGARPDDIPYPRAIAQSLLGVQQESSQRVLSEPGRTAIGAARVIEVRLGKILSQLERSGKARQGLIVTVERLQCEAACRLARHPDQHGRNIYLWGASTRRMVATRLSNSIGLASNSSHPVAMA